MSSSKSKSTTTTQTEQYDMRVLADQASIAIGGEAYVELREEFGENVANAFDELISFAGAAGLAALEQAEKGQQILSKQLAQEREPVELSPFAKALPYIAIAFFGILGFMALRKK